jgi:hypothetical protein
MKFIDLTGKRFGRLTVLRRAKNKVYANGQAFTAWECLCDCGGHIVAISSNLRAGRTKSCGCLLKEALVKHGEIINLKHGQNRKGNATSEYCAWSSMIQRCENPKAHGYDEYGGRGIRICKEWRNSFEQFFNAMGKKPTPLHSLDRIDVNGNYEPGNCRWATKAVQSRNVRRSKRNSAGFKGVQKLADGRYKAVIGVDGGSLFLGYYNNLFDAAMARLAAEEKYWSEHKGGAG